MGQGTNLGGKKQADRWGLQGNEMCGNAGECLRHVMVFDLPLLFWKPQEEMYK